MSINKPFINKQLRHHWHVPIFISLSDKMQIVASASSESGSFRPLHYAKADG